MDRSLVLPLVALALVALTSCSAAAAAKPSASASPLPSVQAVVAQQGTIYPTLQIAGVLAPFRQVGIAADLSEPISEVDVQEGDHVHAGQVLARLLTDDLEAQLASAQRVVGEDVAHYAQTGYQVSAVNTQDQSAIRSAQATLHQAEVNLAGAQVDLQRYLSLASQGYLASQTVDEQRTTVSSDESAVSSARAALNQAEANANANGQGTNAGEQQQELEASRAAADAAQASVQQLQRQLARAVIVAPVDGIVDAVNANPGEYPSGRQLFTIEQTGEMYAILPSSTAQVVRIRQGASASIVPADSNERDAGHVTAVLDQVQPGTTNFTVKVLVPNADGHLHGGMPCTGTLSLPPVSGTKIPVTAFIDDTHAAVYTVRNGIVATQQVAEVQDDGTNAIVTGLPTGSTVVQDVDQSDVGNGDHVAIAAK